MVQWFIVHICADKYLSVRLSVQCSCMAFFFPDLIIITIITNSIWSPVG
jgi:hypothetical protein